MTNFNQKHELMQSLESLDQSQTAQVLNYVKSLRNSTAPGKRSKQEALKQIRQALGNHRALHATF